MLNPPPDPNANLESELRADDDGMPEPPLRAENPKAWDKDRAEREKYHAAGYPLHPVGRAWTDVRHSANRLIGDLRPPRQLSMAVTVAGIGIGLAAYVLLRRNDRHR
jgi:hypothetical protein